MTIPLQQSSKKTKLSLGWNQLLTVKNYIRTQPWKPGEFRVHVTGHCIVQAVAELENDFQSGANAKGKVQQRLCRM